MRQRKGRSVHGILLLDKPIGLSSNQALQQVKRLYQAQKVGHTGALDPLATGMLPVCFGEATKFSSFLLDADKRYRVVAKLGERTTTSDSEGAIIETHPVAVSLAQVEEVLSRFRGKTMQVPSMFSALKYQGKPLYEYARQGITIDRQARQITVYALALIQFTSPLLELEIHCSKGTYIRTIIDDLGQLLGCSAHVIALHRLQVANYPINKMVKLNDLQHIIGREEQLDALLLPMDSAVKHLPEVNLDQQQGARIRQGQTIYDIALPMTEYVRVTVGLSQHFIGIGSVNQQQQLLPERLITENSVPNTLNNSNVDTNYLPYTQDLNH